MCIADKYSRKQLDDMEDVFEDMVEYIAFNSIIKEQNISLNGRKLNVVMGDVKKYMPIIMETTGICDEDYTDVFEYYYDLYSKTIHKKWRVYAFKVRQFEINFIEFMENNILLF